MDPLPRVDFRRDGRYNVNMRIMSLNKLVSLHPKLAAFLELILSLAFLWWLTILGAWWTAAVWLAAKLFLDALIAWFTFHPPSMRRARHFFALVLFDLGMFPLLIFTEWEWAWRGIATVFALLPAVSFWQVPAQTAGELPILHKPYRRVCLALSTLGLYGLWSGVGAFGAFQILYFISHWLWLFLATAVSTAAAFWWWTEYDSNGPTRKFWTYGLAGMTIAIAWSLKLLPFGHHVYGLLVIWFWYILWLLGRFQLSADGIKWKKQFGFIAVNVLLIALFLMAVARWH